MPFGSQRSYYCRIKPDSQVERGPCGEPLRHATLFTTRAGPTFCAVASRIRGGLLRGQGECGDFYAEPAPLQMSDPSVEQGGEVRHLLRSFSQGCGFEEVVFASSAKSAFHGFFTVLEGGKRFLLLSLSF